MKNKMWTFTYSTGVKDGGGQNGWGWNHVNAATESSALKKAQKWVKENYPLGSCDGVSCDAETEKTLMNLFH